MSNWKWNLFSSIAMVNPESNVRIRCVLRSRTRVACRRCLWRTQARNQNQGEKPGNLPPKFSKTCLLVRYKLQSLWNIAWLRPWTYEYEFCNKLPWGLVLENHRNRITALIVHSAKLWSGTVVPTGIPGSTDRFLGIYIDLCMYSRIICLIRLKEISK